MKILIILLLLTTTAHSGIDFNLTKKGLAETKEDYIAYVKYIKKQGLYKNMSPDNHEKLRKLGEKYGVPPESVSSSVGGMVVTSSVPIEN